MRRRAFGVAVCACLGSARVVSAQMTQQPVQLELRNDLIISRWTSDEIGGGLTVPMGWYVRSGLIAGVGGGGKGFDSRADFVSRFNLDPFRQSRWAPYAGGGLSLRYTQRVSPRTHGYLLVIAGVEGPMLGGGRSGWSPAIELGIGGGARFGIALRRAIAGRR